MIALLLLLHLLAVVVWVGGLVFSLFVLRPALAGAGAAERVALHRLALARFLPITWGAMPVALLSGFGLISYFGGFAGANAWVDLMMLLGLVMAVIVVVVALRPWRRLQSAAASGDLAGAETAIAGIRRLNHVNFGLGILAIICAALAQSG